MQSVHWTVSSFKNCMERKRVKESAVVGSIMEEMRTWLETETAKGMENGRREKIVSHRTEGGDHGQHEYPYTEADRQVYAKMMDCVILGSRRNKEEGNRFELV